MKKFAVTHFSGLCLKLREEAIQFVSARGLKKEVKDFGEDVDSVFWSSRRTEHQFTQLRQWENRNSLHLKGHELCYVVSSQSLNDQHIHYKCVTHSWKKDAQIGKKLKLRKLRETAKVLQDEVYTVVKWQSAVDTWNEKIKY